MYTLGTSTYELDRISRTLQERPERSPLQTATRKLRVSGNHDLQDTLRDISTDTLSAIEYEVEADLQNAVEKLDGQDLKGNIISLRADPVNSIQARFAKLQSG